MQKITEIKRHRSPVPLPQALTWDGRHFWIGSLQTQRIYQLDPINWEVLWETEAPGAPFSLLSVGDELRVLTGESEADDRYIRRLIPGAGVELSERIALPELTGSQLSYDGANIYLSQWYNQCLLRLDSTGTVTKRIQIPHGIAGQVIVDDVLYLVTTDEEEQGDYWLTRLDFKAEEPVAKDLARIPFPARSLTYDGRHFWTHHRANQEAVCFQLPQ